MQLVDSHCHLDSKNLRGSADDVLGRAKAAGVGAFVCVGVGDTAEAAQFAVELATRRKDVVAVVGMHPHDAKALDDTLWHQLEAMSHHTRVSAVGEIGLDYHYDHSPRDVQKTVFRRMIGLAREVRKPIVVHTREAAADTLAVLDEERAHEVGGVIHCFSEDPAFAKAMLDRGFDLSFSGILTFKNADPIRAAAAYAPSDRILVETDSPYLSPLPVRGKRCEPAFVVHTARALAAVRGVSVEQITEHTSTNAARRFSLELAALSAHD